MPKLECCTTITTDVDVEIEISVYCATCGAGLCNQSRFGRRFGNEKFLEVEVCEKCKDNAYDDGFEKGKSEGYEEARKEFEK